MRKRSTREGVLVLRSACLFGFLLLLFVGLAGRFFELMVLRHEEFSRLAVRQVRRTEPVRALRGEIRDRHGRQLAFTRALPTVVVDPSLVDPEERDDLGFLLASALEVEPAKVRQHLSKRSRYRRIRRRIREPRIVDRIPDLAQHPAVYVEEEPGRSYPHGRLAAHLLGFTGADGTGLAGVEQALDSVLSGTPGKRVVLRDGHTSRRISAGEIIEPARDGEHVVLAMDLTIQSFAEEALDRAVADWSPAAATAVVLDPRTSDVLAIAGRPGFDPRRFGDASPEAFRIRAVTDPRPVGSVIKPLLVTGALDAGVVSFDERKDCENGCWLACGRRRVRDSHPHGVLTVPEIVIKSSNIGAAKIAHEYGIERTRALLSVLGFGRRTGCGLPSESAGVLPARWTVPYALTSVAFGQEIAATPLQFATAFASLAAGGVVRKPRVFLRIGRRAVEPDPGRRAFSRETVRNLMVPTLERVVTEGTGKRGAIDGYRVCGKTGTAQILDRHGPTGEHVCSFVTFAPAEDPRFLVLVVIDRPEETREVSGGRTAAPYAREILARCLRYAEIPPAVEPDEPERVAPAPRSTKVVVPRRSNRDIDLMQLRMWQQEER